MRITSRLTALMASGMVFGVVSGSAASAQDFLVYGGAALEFTYEEMGPDTGTISYLSGYVELEKAGFYTGVWAQLADDDLLNEVDLYLGYRSETAAGLAYNAYYTRYYYPNDGNDGGGEFSLEFDAPFGDQFRGWLDFYYSPEFEGVSALGSAYVGGAWMVTDTVELSANYGVYEVDLASNETEWDIGGTYFVGDETGIDLRYYDGTEYLGSYLGLSLTWDTTLLGG